MIRRPALALFLLGLCAIGLFAPNMVLPLSLAFRGFAFVIITVTVLGMSNAELRDTPRMGLAMTAVGTAFIGTGIIDAESPLAHMGQILGSAGFALFVATVFGPPVWFWSAYKIRQAMAGRRA